jgi:HlyD family secretion protein
VGGKGLALRRGLILGGVVTGAALTGLLLWLAFAPSSVNADVLSGYVEADPLYLASPVSGTVASLSVTDGERVVPNAPLFTVDARSMMANRDQAEAALAQARDQAAAAQASLSQQEANLAQAKAQAANASRDAARYAGVARDGGASAQDIDRASTAATNGWAAQRAAEALVHNTRSQLAAADAGIAHARAVLADAQAKLDQLSVRMPATGRIERAYFQVGEWAPANQPIVSVIADGKIRVRFFVPEGDISLYQPGKRVRFNCDSCGGPRGATIVYVSPQPEYTPPIIYSRRTRERMVFLVEARPDSPGTLNPGQPVDVTPLGRLVAPRQ